MSGSKTEASAAINAAVNSANIDTSGEKIGKQQSSEVQQVSAKFETEIKNAQGRTQSLESVSNAVNQIVANANRAAADLGKEGRVIPEPAAPTPSTPSSK